LIAQNNIQKASLDQACHGKITASRYSLLACLYFFFNSVLLPKGMLFTHLLSPVFYYNLIRNRRRTFAFPFFVFLLFFDSIHIYYGVDLFSFVISNGLFISTYFCVASFYHFVNHFENLKMIYRNILFFNTVMVLIAIPFLFLPRHYQEWFWYINKITRGVVNFPRLAMFTYEASYYSLLFVPIFYYYSFRLILGGFKARLWQNFVLIFIPMLLSLSFGVLGTTFVVALMMCFIFWRKLFLYKKAFIAVFTTIAGFLIIMGVLAIYFPENILFVRIENMWMGTDTSTRGRTIDSFSMAWRVAGTRSIFFGSGLGQIKLLAVEVAHAYFKHWGLKARYDIPNAMGETLAIFGLAGVVLRLFLEFFLFFKTRVYSNYYRLALFIFVFIYQFTGSFITNIVEYVIWILAFSTVFNQFNILKR
jgi:hypothetical protein